MAYRRHSECTFSIFCWNITVFLRNRNNNNDSMIMTTASSSRTSNSSDDEAQEIRQRAYDLLNRMGGPEPEVDDEKDWPQSPAHSRQSVPFSSYQQQTAGEASRARSSFSLPPSTPRSSASSSFTELFVHCVSDACKTASSEIIKTGYDSLKSVIIPEAEDRFFAARSKKTYAPVSGTYQTVDIPQGYRGRYTDNPMDGGNK